MRTNAHAQHSELKSSWYWQQTAVTEMKCTLNAEEAESGPAAKQYVLYSTFLKWQGEMDREFQKISWLDSEVRNERVKKIDK